MTYDKFLEETNILIASYEADRQELADKYQRDIDRLHSKLEDKKLKLFEEYKKEQKKKDLSV